MANGGSKFKAALDISDPTLKRYYDELMSVRNQVRNFVAHGAFGKDGESIPASILVLARCLYYCPIAQAITHTAFLTAWIFLGGIVALLTMTQSY